MLWSSGTNHSRVRTLQRSPTPLSVAEEHGAAAMRLCREQSAGAYPLCLLTGHREGVVWAVRSTLRTSGRLLVSTHHCGTQRLPMPGRRWLPECLFVATPRPLRFPAPPVCPHACAGFNVHFYFRPRLPGLHTGRKAHTPVPWRYAFEAPPLVRRASARHTGGGPPPDNQNCLRAATEEARGEYAGELQQRTSPVWP